MSDTHPGTLSACIAWSKSKDTLWASACAEAGEVWATCKHADLASVLLAMDTREPKAVRPSSFWRWTLVTPRGPQSDFRCGFVVEWFRRRRGCGKAIVKGPEGPAVVASMLTITCQWSGPWSTERLDALVLCGPSGSFFSGSTCLWSCHTTPHVVVRCAWDTVL